MQSHDLARQLLALPNREVFYDDGDEDLLEIDSAEEEDEGIVLGCDGDDGDDDGEDSNVIEAEFAPIAAR